MPGFSLNIPNQQGIAAQLQAQLAASKALPSVQSRPPEVNALGSKSLTRYIVDLPVGGVTPVMVQGDFFYIESLLAFDGSPLANLVNVTAKADTSDVSVPLIAIGQKYRYETPFNNLQIINSISNVHQTLIIWVGFGDYIAPIVRGGFVEQSIAMTLANVTNAAAYAAGNVVGGGAASITLNQQFFLPGFPRASLIRARLAFSGNLVAGTNVALISWNGNATAQQQTDHVAMADLLVNLPALQPPVQFPAFRQDGAAPYFYCDVTNIKNPMFPGAPGALGPLGVPAAYALYVTLVANGAFSLANPTTPRLDLVVQYW